MEHYTKKQVEDLIVQFADENVLLGSRQDIKEVNRFIKENL